MATYSIIRRDSRGKDSSSSLDLGSRLSYYYIRFERRCDKRISYVASRRESIPVNIISVTIAVGFHGVNYDADFYKLIRAIVL